MAHSNVFVTADVGSNSTLHYKRISISILQGAHIIATLLCVSGGLGPCQQSYRKILKWCYNLGQAVVDKYVFLWNILKLIFCNFMPQNVTKFGFWVAGWVRDISISYSLSPSSVLFVVKINFTKK